MYRKNKIKAIVALAVALAFVMPGAASSIVSVSSSDTVTTTAYDIEVDDDADPDWYDATHVKTIQEGVNNATAGDTIFVYNGIYNTYDEITVNKSVDLVGHSRWLVNLFASTCRLLLMLPLQTAIYMAIGLATGLVSNYWVRITTSSQAVICTTIRVASTCDLVQII